MRLLFVFVWVLVLLFSCEIEKTIESKPNIILIMTDDQGNGDVGYHGNPIVKTPNIDKLSVEGVRLTQFYVSPVCAPTRSSLLSGKFSLRTGVIDTYNGGAIMSDEVVTVAEVVKQAGYKTGVFGKWHVGDSYPFRPKDQGFDESLVHRGGGVGQPGDLTNYFKNNRSYFDPVLLKNGEEIQTKGYCSDVYTDGALEFIDKAGEDPFFCYLSFNAPHTPLQLPKEYYDMYKDDPITYDGFTKHERPYPEMNPALKETARKIYGMVTNIDDNIGKLIEHLKDKNKLDNTIIIFLTDNGPQQARYNSGLRARKGSVYEGGIRVPFIISGPGIPNDKEINEAIAHIDVLPTIAELAGIAPPSDIDGRSFLSLAKGSSDTWSERALYYYWTRGFEKPYRNVAIRKGDYKLVMQNQYDDPVDSFELYNIANDIGEQTNIIQSNLSIAGELKKNWDEWYKKTMQNDLLGKVSFHIGTEHENPTILNLNDAWGTIAAWGNEGTIGYWKVQTESGVYGINMKFRRKMAPGNAFVRIGTVQRSFAVKDSTDLVKMADMQLFEQKTTAEVWYRERGKGYNEVIMPLYISIERKK